MKKYIYIFSTFALLGIAAVVLKVSLRKVSPGSSISSALIIEPEQFSSLNEGDMINLPDPVTDGTVSLEKSLSMRRSVRSYSNQPMKPGEVSQLLWAAQGITNEQGFRTAPSAGATFPLEIFVLVNSVEGMKKGIYQYQPGGHSLLMVREADVSAELARAALSQSMITDAGVVVIFAADFQRTTSRYGERGIRYVYNEIGHASQNVHLQAAALNLGTVVVGAFRDEEVEEVLQLSDTLRVIYLMPVGHIR